MRESIRQELEELKSAGVISPETAEAIRSYYANRPHPPASNRLLIAFGVLGALLVGSGIMLILAHNWDEIPRGIRTILAFLPLLAGQGISLYALLRKPDSRVWHEAGAVLTFTAVAAAIALVHQIYNLPEHHISRFLMAWAVLTFPLMFLMRSSAVSLLYVSIITWYAQETFEKGWGMSEALSPWWYFVLLLPALGYFAWMRMVQPGSNTLALLQWFIPFSLFMGTIGLAVEADEAGFLVMIALAGAVYAAGSTPLISTSRSVANGFRILAGSGLLLSMYILSFSFFWEEWETGQLTASFFADMPVILTLAMALGWMAGFGYALYKDRSVLLDPFLWIPLPLSLFFLIGLSQPTFAWIGVNLLLFLAGVLMIWNGSRKDHIGVMNIGLLTLAIHIMCRFFDAEISFVLRGVIFMLLGAAFFGVNWMMMRRRRTIQNQNGEGE